MWGQFKKEISGRHLFKPKIIFIKKTNSSVVTEWLFSVYFCACSHTLQGTYKNTTSKLAITTFMPPSLIRHLIHQPLLSQWPIVWCIFLINQERISSEQALLKLRRQKPALIHTTRQGQTRHYNKCLFFDKLEGVNWLSLNTLSWLHKLEWNTIRRIAILPFFVCICRQVLRNFITLMLLRNTK